MDTDAGTETGKGKRRKANARKDQSGQEVVQRPQVVKNAATELIAAKKKLAHATETLSKLIKKVAEESGYNAKAIRGWLGATVGESFEKAKRDIDQQAELFEEVGETKPQ